MADLFANGRIVDGILILMLFELVALSALRKKTQRGLSAPRLIVSLLAGAALLLSLRAALTAQPWPVTSFWLFAALIAHALDLRLRWCAE